jgi:hypothetical protein
MGNVNPPTTVAGGAANFYGNGAIGSGDKFPSLLPISLQVAARTIGFDIVPVIPMNGPTGVLTYLDYVYAGGVEPGKAINDLSDSYKGTRTWEDALLIEVETEFLVTDSDQPLVDAVAIPGDKVTLAAAIEAATSFGAAADDLVVKYVGNSRITGNYIFQVSKASTQTVASIFLGDNSVLTADTSALTIVLPGETPGTDDGEISIITTAKAALVKTPENHIQGFTGAGLEDGDDWYGNAVDGTKNPQPMRRGVGETTYYRPIGLETFTKFVEAGTYQASAVVTTEQIQDLNRQYGIDVVGMVENQLINEISKSINYHILSRAFALGWDNHINFDKVESMNLNMSFDGATTAGFIKKDGLIGDMSVPEVQAVTTNSFENQSTMQRRVMGIILAAGNVVSQRGRRGPANFVVTNLQMATVLQDNAQYQFAPMANTINQNNGSLYPVGTVAGMTIYVDPNMAWADTRILVGRKGADEEPGLKFMPYMMAESIQTIAEGTMSPKIAVKSRYALVEAGFHPETLYMTVFIETGNMLIGAGKAL